MRRGVVFFFAFLQSGAAIAGGEKLSTTYVLRPVVMPAMPWLVEAGVDLTTTPGGDPLVLLPNLSTRYGLPSLWLIPWGFEVGATIPTFVVSPSFDFAAKGYLMLRTFPFVNEPPPTESRAGFELATKLELGRDPTDPMLPFRAELSLPAIVRPAGDRFRVDLVPSLAWLPAVERVAFATRVLLSLQLLDRLWAGLDTGVAIPDLGDGATTAIPLGLQAGLTFPGELGPIFELMIEGGFPRFLVPGSAGDALDAETVRVAAFFRLYTYWILSATQAGPEIPEHRRRCERDRGTGCPTP